MENESIDEWPDESGFELPARYDRTNARALCADKNARPLTAEIRNVPMKR